MSDSFFEQRFLQLGIHADDWRDALARTAQPLIDDGAIDEAYIDSMIAAVEKLGPYIVIAPGLALGHARPDGAVHRPCVAMATLDTPLRFGSEQNDPVDIVVVFAAVDDSAHIELLKKLVLFFNEPGSLDNLRDARTAADAQSIACAISEGA